MTVTTHFAERVRERCGPEIDADLLWRGISEAIRLGRDDLVQFVSRLTTRGRRLFRFRLNDGREFYIVVNTDANVPLTVLEPGFVVRRHDGRNPLHLDCDEVAE